MAKTFTPPFVQIGNIGGTLVTAANTSSQGGGTIGTNIFVAFTAGADGSYIESVNIMATATAPTSTTATVARLFLSSVSSGATTSSDTSLIAEIQLPVTAADSATLATQPFIWPLNRMIPPNWTLLVTNHAAPAANTAWEFVVFGGDY